MDLTLLEIHLPNAEFNAPFAGESGESKSEPGADRDAREGEASGSGPDARPLIVLLVLVGLALLARYLRSRSGGEESSETSVEPAERDS